VRPAAGADRAGRVAAVQSAFLLVLGVGGAGWPPARSSVGDLVAFVLFLFFLIMPLGQALHAYTQLQTGLGALQRMTRILDLPPRARRSRAGRCRHRRRARGVRPGRLRLPRRPAGAARGQLPRAGGSRTRWSGRRAPASRRSWR
jgi:ATP-binding cassette subfamily B protein/ATP-binding cassette subfamily C protein